MVELGNAALRAALCRRDRRMVPDGAAPSQCNAIRLSLLSRSVFYLAVRPRNALYDTDGAGPLARTSGNDRRFGTVDATVLSLVVGRLFSYERNVSCCRPS